jgi:hypothetical protein
MLLLLVGLVAGYWAGFWIGYLNRNEVSKVLETGKIDWK